MSIADIGPRPQALRPGVRDAREPELPHRGLERELPAGHPHVDSGQRRHRTREAPRHRPVHSARPRPRSSPDGTGKDELTFDQEVTDGWCVIVPAGSWHNITNVGDEPMQVYTVYAPQHHKPGKVHQTKAIADTDTDDEPADWSVQPDPVADQHA